MFLMLASPELAWAGMPSIGLTEIARLRVEAISFFLLVFLGCAALIRVLWNWLAKDITWLPRLGYGKAVGLTALWGLLLVIVLTMISGARVLMTPGAWEKNGGTYRLRSGAHSAPAPGAVESLAAAPTASSPTADARSSRRDRLAMLGIALRQFALEHDNVFPADESVVGVSDASWQVAERSTHRYRYIRDRSLAGAASPVVYEPDIFDGEQFVYFTDGEIQLMTKPELAHLLSPEIEP